MMMTKWEIPKCSQHFSIYFAIHVWVWWGNAYLYNSRLELKLGHAVSLYTILNQNISKAKAIYVREYKMWYCCICVSDAIATGSSKHKLCLYTNEHAPHFPFYSVYRSKSKVHNTYLHLTFPSPIRCV